VVVNNSTNIKKNDHLSPLTSFHWLQHMMLDIQVLVSDRHNIVAGLIWLMGSQRWPLTIESPSKLNIHRQYHRNNVFVTDGFYYCILKIIILIKGHSRFQRLKEPVPDLPLCLCVLKHRAPLTRGGSSSCQKINLRWIFAYVVF
jgi:hypothetical protein